jgi:DNA invertase Pin-like site-specific DNA recombinase
MENEATDLQEWMPEENPNISLEQVEALIRELSTKRLERDKAKELSTALHHEVEEVEKRVLNALKAKGKTKYELEGIGRVNLITKEIYSTPKTNEQKIALFNYIKSKYGPDVMMSMTSVNHQTLNSWCNKETEGNPTLKIPGLDAPTTNEECRFTKAKE